MEKRENFFNLDITYIPEVYKRKAEEELHETEENCSCCLRTMKLMLLEDDDLVPCVEDDVIIRFLRAQKFNCERTLLLLKKYHCHRQKYSNLYVDFSPRSVTKTINSKIMTFLPYRTAEGCAIWVSKFGEWNPRVSSFEEILKFGFMCLETASQYPVTQIAGVVNILDLQNMSYMQLLQITPGRLRFFVSGVQDSFPLRQKAIHVVFEPPLFSFLFRLVSPLLNRKIKERIHLHGTNMKSLHQYIPPEILPEKYGGTLQSFYEEHFYDSVNKYEDQLIKMNHCYISKTH